jgi:hypothetical protein
METGAPEREFPAILGWIETLWPNMNKPQTFYRNKYKLYYNWLIDCLRFYVQLKNFSFIWRRHHYRWRAAKFRPMLGSYGLWAGRDLYCVTPAVTRGLGFSGLIWRTTPFNRLLRLARGCGWPILTWILKGPHSVASYDSQGDAPDHHGGSILWVTLIF